MSSCSTYQLSTPMQPLTAETGQPGTSECLDSATAVSTSRQAHSTRSEVVLPSLHLSLFFNLSWRQNWKTKTPAMNELVAYEELVNQPFLGSRGSNHFTWNSFWKSTQCFWTKCIPTLIGSKSSAIHMNLVAFNFFKKLIKKLSNSLHLWKINMAD